MNSPAYFEIHVEDFDRAMKFYGEIFGWEFKEAEGLGLEYYRIHTEGARGGMIKRVGAKNPEGSGPNSFVNSIQVLNFDEISEKIADHGGKVALAKFAVAGICWQGYFFDTEGNVFGLFEADPNAK